MKASFYFSRNTFVKFCNLNRLLLLEVSADADLDTVFYFGGTVLGFFEACCVTTFNALNLVNLLSFVARYSDEGALKGSRLDGLDWLGSMSSFRVVTLANSEEHHNGNCITEFLMKVCFYRNGVN